MNLAEWFSAADAATRAVGQAARRRATHLIERMRDRAISVSDLKQLRLWVEMCPEVPEGDWYKDFGSWRASRIDPVTALRQD